MVQKRLLIWFGHTNAMKEARRPGEVLTWVTQETRKQGRPRRGWRCDIKGEMEARDLAEEDCYGREE
jgi:hypothetical protein